MVDEAAPSVINIILELSFVNMVVYLSANALHLSVRIDLTPSAFEIVPITSHVVVDGGVAVPFNVGGVEYSQLLPFLHISTEVGRNMENW